MTVMVSISNRIIAILILGHFSLSYLLFIPSSIGQIDYSKNKKNE